MHMLRLTGALLVGGLLVGASLALTATAAPRGKVVRVERVRSCPPSTPVICFQVQSDGSGMCVGPQPKVGDVVVLVDETAVIAEIRVDGTSKPMSNCEVVWQVTGTVLKGDVANGKRSKAMGLID